MQNPTLIATPFAENGDKNTIPESVGAEPQNATMQAGFPPITQEKISAGGIPPERNDFNGILNALSQHTVFLNKGGRYGFDAEFAAKIGGYEKGACLTLDDGTQVVSDIDANINNPNTDLTGWIFLPIKVKASNVLDESGLTQQNINDDVMGYKYANYQYDIRKFGVVADKTTDWTSKILEVVASLPESSSLFIPVGVKWQATSIADQVYAAMPPNTTIFDDSGYESRYSYPDENDRWQSSQQIYYNTKDYGSAGRRNGNGLNLRAIYHPYLNFQIDAPVGTGGCKGSIIWYGNNTLRDNLQLGMNQDSLDKSCLQIASYGTYANGATCFKMGAQSSITPHSFNFNSDIVSGISYNFGKRVKITNPSMTVEDDATWQASTHAVRWVQLSGHTGSFTQNWVYGTTQAFRQTVFNDGTVEFLTLNSGRMTLTADGGLQSKRNVLDRTSSINLTSIQSGSYISNIGTSANINVVLPKAVKGLSFEISVDFAFNIRVLVNAADNFISKETGKYMESLTVGSKLRVVAVSSTQWSFDRTGTWVDQP